MQYKTGTCSVTNGSATVTFSGADSGAENVAVGDSFKVDRDGEAIYQIASRTPASGASLTSITLTTNYGGTTGSGLGYQIVSDFTPNRSYPELAQGDADAADWLTKALRKIDEDVGNIMSQYAKLSENETITGNWTFTPSSGNTAFTAGGVGIGIANPDNSLLHIYGGASGVTSLTSDQLIIEDDTVTRISLNAPHANTRHLNFGNPYDNAANYIIQGGTAAGDYTGDYMGFNVGNSRIMTLINKNVGIGNSSLESWASQWSVLQIGGNANIIADTAAGAGKFLVLTQNAYIDAGGWKYQDTVNASYYDQSAGVHTFQVSQSGTADTTITWTTALIIGNDGSLTALPVYSDIVGGTNRDLYIDNTGLIGYVSSSRRYKKNIRDMVDINWLYDLRPVEFEYKRDSTYAMGLIAEEVAEIQEYLITRNEQGEPESVEYSRLISAMLKAIQELKAQLNVQ